MLCCALIFLFGCSRTTDLTIDEPATVAVQSDEPGVAVDAKQGWTDSGFDVTAGDAITIQADGRIVFRKRKLVNDSDPVTSGPNGTYHYRDDVVEKPFPLPAAAGGPAPPYSLIARIGNGPVFYVGANKSFIAKQTGRLQLGINDYRLDDNSGQFTVRIRKPNSVQPASFVQSVMPTISKSGRPVPGASVVILYIDGLRPDVVREMVAMGHLPNIGKLFVRGGAWLENTFTVFPSDTITSNGTMWTGCFSDRHGLKGQVRFSRRSLFSQSYLEPMGPNRSARLLSPRGLNRVLHNTQKRALELVQGKQASRRWSRTHVTNVSPIYAHLQRQGSDWATGVLPMMTEVPPILWTQSLVRHMPYFRSERAWESVDDANADYAVRHLIARKAPVTIVWLPETDTVSHKYSRGQFGITRRTIARADRLIGEIVGELAAQKRLQNTYLFLVSDHGHHGGRVSHLSHFDIANDLFYQPRQRTKDGRWVGGGLGMSVRQHRYWNRHTGDASRNFVFLDADSDGAARIFLPRGHYASGKWMGERRPADYLQYRIAKDLQPVDLVATLTNWQSTDGQGRVDRPVDLVLMKLSDSSVLISTHDRGHAVIDRKKGTRGEWRYRYTVVTNPRPASTGDVTFEVVAKPTVDPLGITSLPGRLNLTNFFSERFWLAATARTQYPDGVVALTRHVLWQKALRYREEEFAPDLIVTAKRGWYFGTKSSPGTMHGYPFFESMRASMFVTGPNIHRGARIDIAHRMADLTPTVLEMVGREYDPADFDGRPMRAIYRPQQGKTIHADLRPVYWDDYDLQAWQPVNYRPVKKSRHLPFTVNRPDSPFDLNNIAYNAITLTDLNVLRLADDILLPFRGQRSGVSASVEKLEREAVQRNSAWFAAAVRGLNASGVSVADYSTTSTGNLMRIDGAIEWLQDGGRRLDADIANRLGFDTLPGSRYVNMGIDGTQFAFWESYRFAQRIMAELLDETILNSVEDSTDRTINYFRRTPADVYVKPRKR